MVAELKRSWTMRCWVGDRGEGLGVLRGRGGIPLVLWLSVWQLAAAPALASGDAGRRHPERRPHFEDVTAEAGLEYVHHIPTEAPDCIFQAGQFCEPERISGGAAVGDVDRDGDPDLFVTRLDAPDILFRNMGDGHFVDATNVSGLAGFDLQSNGAAFADVDGDGDLDLYVTVFGDAGDPVNNRNYLFINDGQGAFQEEALARGAAIESPSQRRGFSVVFGDYDRDGFVDLHVSEWLPFGISHSRLLHNRGAAAPGFFEDVTDAAGVNLQQSDAFGGAFSDLDADGWPDLAIAADFGTSRLFWNNGDGTFTDGTVASGVGTDENGMGSTFGDIDADGDLDWFVTSIFDPEATCDFVVCNWGYTGNRLYRNDGNRSFSDATDRAGVRDGYWGWGAAFFDYDNDGDLDLAMTNGVDFPGSVVEDVYNQDPMRLWENDGSGTMTEISGRAGLTDTGAGKGLVVFDYDLDGDLDLFVVNNPGAPRLYRNTGGRRGSWLRVVARGQWGNTEGLGARVTVYSSLRTPVQVREIGTSTHFLGQSERVAHFGLGGHPKRIRRVTVKWPSGRVQTFRNIATNQTLVAVEPRAACGLLGLEPFAALAVARAARRARK